MSSRGFLALGSNLGDSVKQVNLALTALNDLPQTQLVQCSPFYRSKPLGPQNQPDFLNAVCEIVTSLDAETLLDHTQKIEHDLGRVRKAERFGPRTLDIDILLFNDDIIQTERLIVPHYDMMNREFVLYPLYDIAPDLHFPDHTTLSDRLKTLDKNGLTHWN